MAKTKAAKPAGRQIRMVKIGDLKPYPDNARTHTDAQVGQIVASLREFGWTNPVLIGADSGIIAGHARVEAAKQSGLKEVPCIELKGLTEAQRQAYVLADNKLALNAGWNEDLLRRELLELQEADFNLDLLGFTSEELADITLGPEISQPEYDESAADGVEMMTCPHCGKTFPK